MRAPEVMLALSGRERSCPSEPVRWPTTSLRPHPLNPPGELDPSEVEELTDSIVAHAAQGGILQPAARHAGWAVIADQASTDSSVSHAVKLAGVVADTQLALDGRGDALWVHRPAARRGVGALGKKGRRLLQSAAPPPIRRCL